MAIIEKTPNYGIKRQLSSQYCFRKSQIIKILDNEERTNGGKMRIMQD